MANSAQARKRARQAVKQNAHNSSLRSELRTAVKKVIKAIEAGRQDLRDLEDAMDRIGSAFLEEQAGLSPKTATSNDDK